MLIALLIFLLVTPILRQLQVSPLVPLVYAATLLGGMWSLLGRGRWFWIGIALAGTGTIAALVSFYLNRVGVPLLTEVVLFVLLLLILGLSLRQVLTGGRVDANRLLGAVCVYLIFGILWAVLYHWLALLVPGAFAGSAISSTTDLWEFVYYSFVTLTTLGYGEITPKSDLARTLAYLEAVTGVFYVAILVATLVGSYLAPNQTDKSVS